VLVLCDAEAEGSRDGGEELLRGGGLWNDFVAGGVLGVRSEIVAAEENGANAGVAVFHFIAKGEAVHRLKDDLGDDEIDVLALDEIDALLAGVGADDFVARSFLEDVEGCSDFFFPVYDEYFHRCGFICQEGRAGRDLFS
jgi:hypothetical protein